MRIIDRHREILTPHLTLKSDRVLAPGAIAPTAVFGLVAALVKPEEIEASIVRVNTVQQRTLWTAMLVTSKAFAEVRVNFDAETFQGGEERDRFSSNQPLKFEVQHARADLLDGIARAEFVPNENLQHI